MYAKQIIILLLVGYGILAPDITFGFEIIPTTTERHMNKDGRCQQEIKNLRDQQNFWIRFYNESCEARQIQKEHLCEKKLEETNAEFGNKQKELIATVNKQNILLQQLDLKIEKISAEFGNKKDELMQHFDEKLGEMETKLVNIQELLEEFKKENLGEVERVKTYLPRNCMEVLERGDTLSGVYTIQPINTNFKVWCDMTTRDGGWTYVLNRFNGSQDFYLGWDDYKNGFGNLSGEFWLGLQHLYELTGFQNNQLLIDLVDWDNKHFHAMYCKFRIGSEEEGYPIKVLDCYSGDTHDSLTFHKNVKFSTYDRNSWSGGNYAIFYRGAWWYDNFVYCSLTGNYFSDKPHSPKGVVWFDNEKYLRLKKVKMMVRPNYLQ